MIRDESQRMERNLNAFHQDGLLDIFIGLGILLTAVFFGSELFWLTAILPAVGYPVWQSGKKIITEPRIKTQLEDPRKIAAVRRSITGFMVVAMVSLVLGMVMFALLSIDLLTSGAQTWLLEHFPVVIGVIGGFLFALTAFLSKINRFYFYGVLTLIFISGGALLRMPGMLYGASLGLVILAYGLILLIRFVQEYPKPVS